MDFDKLTFREKCPVCAWMQEWAKRPNADFGMLMQAYIPHSLEHAITELTGKL